MSADTRVRELLERWQQQRACGRPVTPEELCRDCPEWLEAVRKGIRGLEAGLPTLPETTPDFSGPVTPPPPRGTGPLPAERFAGTRYRLLHFHRRGGQGEVFVAHDDELNREVALKRIQDQQRDNPAARRRFLLEAEFTGRLQHPGVVPVYSLGRDAAGEPYYTMRFVVGQSLQDAIRDFHTADRQPGRDPGERSLAFRELLNRFVAVSNVVAYAHSRGVIHRDLKPANVLLGKYGETLVADWGLAKAVGRAAAEGAPDEQTLTPRDDGDGQTVQGLGAGTPAYASPEQSRGEWDRVGPASDVYSLGATLYALLTGAPPGRDGDRPPGKGRRAGARVPAALEAVCRKALAFRPEDRYPSARALAADVEHWLADEPVSAYREPARLRLRRWARRHRPQVVAAAAVLLATAVLGGLGAWWYHHDQNTRAAERAARLAVTERGVAAALGEAESFNKEGWAQTDDPDRWRATVGLASSAVRRAENLLATGVATEDLAQRVRRARAVDEAEAGSRLSRELDRIRLDRGVMKGNRSINARAAARYEAAFRDYGVDLTSPAAAVERVRASRLRPVLLAALFNWATLADRGEQVKRWRVVLAVDPEFKGFLLRWGAATQRRDGPALRKLAEGEARGLPPALLTQLASDLVAKGETTVAEEMLRGALDRYPRDFWLNYVLGTMLGRQGPARAEEGARFLTAALAVRGPNAVVYTDLGNTLAARGDVEGAIRSYRRALAVDPNHAFAHCGLGNALHEKRDVEGAIRSYQRALDLDPKFVLAHSNLGNALRDNGDPEGAVAACRRALDLDPDYAPAHNNLGLALRDKGDVEGAIAAYRRAIALDPREAKFHNNLGLALKARNDLAGAVRAYQRAIDLDPKYARAHNDLGLALKDRKDWEGAIRCYRKALDLDPRFVAAHHNLGVALGARGDVDGAIRCFRAALEIDPRDAAAHQNLGSALLRTGDTPEAIRCFRAALGINPKLGEAHAALGYALLTQERLGEALASLQDALRLMPDRHPLRGFSARQLQTCEALLALGPRLPAVLRGEAQPRNPAEGILLARFRQTHKKQYAAAARLYAAAFAAGPELADDLMQANRYDAACAAARAGCGRGQDAARLGPDERARLRRQALGWLRADLAARARLLDRDSKQAGEVAQKLKHWQKDPNLAGLRDPDALAKLPEAERAGWQRLWAEVSDLLRRAGDGAKPAAP